MEKLFALLKEIKPGVDFEKETALVDKGLIDSMDVVEIVNEICDVFDLEIPIEEVDPDNFNSAGAMMEMIQRLS